MIIVTHSSLASFKWENLTTIRSTNQEKMLKRFLLLCIIHRNNKLRKNINKQNKLTINTKQTTHFVTCKNNKLHTLSAFPNEKWYLRREAAPRYFLASPTSIMQRRNKKSCWILLSRQWPTIYLIRNTLDRQCFTIQSFDLFTNMGDKLIIILLN